MRPRRLNAQRRPGGRRCIGRERVWIGGGGGEQRQHDLFDRLLAEHGAGIPIPALLRIIAADCPWMQAAQIRDVCSIHLPQLSGLRVE